ncbi:zinc finger, GRF-type containing protein [Tanacetum coccineum]
MVHCACGLEAVIRTSWTNRNPGRRFYGCPTLTQREAQQANELSNLTRQRQLLASVNYRRAIIEELERLPGNLVACKTTEHLKRIQKAVFVEVIDLKKELRLQREVQLATEINNLTRQLLDIIDEIRLFIGELEQRLPTNVMAYKTRQELKCHQKDDMIRAMEMRSTALQLHHQAMKGFHFYKSL